MSDLENHGTPEWANELAARAACDMDLLFTPHPQWRGHVAGRVPSFYDPHAQLMLDAEARVHMCEAQLDDLRRALEYLPKDWRFGEVERARFADYLRTRLTAFEQFPARLDDIERRAFSYRPS